MPLNASRSARHCKPLLLQTTQITSQSNPIQSNPIQSNPLISTHQCECECECDTSIDHEIRTSKSPPEARLPIHAALWTISSSTSFDTSMPSDFVVVVVAVVVVLALVILVLLVAIASLSTRKPTRTGTMSYSMNQRLFRADPIEAFLMVCTKVAVDTPWLNQQITVEWWSSTSNRGSTCQHFQLPTYIRTAPQLFAQDLDLTTSTTNDLRMCNRHDDGGDGDVMMWW
jgi:preprotein translocase subunit SecG